MRRFNHDLFLGTRLILAAMLALGVNGYAQQTAPAQGEPGAQTQGQGHGGRRGQFAGMARAAGEITAVAGNTLTVKAEDGTTVQVVTTDNTRVMKDRATVKISELHPGDGLMAVGNLDPATHTLHAAMVMAEDAAQVKAMRENLGKTYITGRVTAVDLDDAQMTVERPDHVTQTIGFDETTSFRRAVRGERPAGTNGSTPGAGSGNGYGRAGGYGGGMGRGMGMGDPTAAIDRGFANGESITLADIKPGDFIVATGSVKGGQFVPTRLLDSPAGQRRQRQNETPAAGATPPAGQPGPGAQ